jgi:hypothetical protein
MDLIPHFTRAPFHNDHRGTQLLGSDVPIDNLLRLGPGRRTRHGEIVHQEDDEYGEEYARKDAS